MKNASMPAMPFTEYDGNGVIYYQTPGLTKYEHACIALRVPETGDPEIDALIREARRMDFAQAAMQSAYMLHMDGTRNVDIDAAALSSEADAVADALLAALDAKRPVEPKP